MLLIKPQRRKWRSFILNNETVYSQTRFNIYRDLIWFGQKKNASIRQKQWEKRNRLLLCLELRWYHREGSSVMTFILKNERSRSRGASSRQLSASWNFSWLIEDIRTRLNDLKRHVLPQKKRPQNLLKRLRLFPQRRQTLPTSCSWNLQKLLLAKGRRRRTRKEMDKTKVRLQINSSSRFIAQKTAWQQLIPR